MHTTRDTKINHQNINELALKWLNQEEVSAVQDQLLSEFAELLSLTKEQALVLASIYSMHTESEAPIDKWLLEKTKEMLDLQSVSAILQHLDKQGLIEIEKGSRRRGNELIPSQGVIGFIKTANPGYLSICEEPGGNGLLNLCLSWHTRENDPFGFSKPRASVVRALIDYHDHPFVKRIGLLSSDINEQSAALFILGHEALFRSPMKVSQLVEELFHQPLPRLKVFHDWSNPKSELYKKGLMEAYSVIDGQVTEVRINPTLIQWALPKDMSNAHMIRGLRSHFVELIEPESIQAVRLRYPFEFQLEVDIFFENLQVKRFQSYVKNLKSRGLPPNLSAMLYGAPGTGKTELVRQLSRQYKRPLLTVNLAGLRDKYFGESEKNIARLFSEIRAISSQLKREPIVLFNEADGFFHQRSASGRGVDQTETALVALFLNELETFKGIVFATSNHTGSMDKAFERRWTLKLEVPAPDERVRAQIMFDKFKGLVPFRAIQQLAKRHMFSPAQVDNILKKFLLVNPSEEKVNVLEQLIIHEVGGWTPETKRIGFN